MLKRKIEDNEGKKIRPTERKFTFKMQKKLVILFFMVLLAFLGLSVRLFLITRDDGDDYTKQVLSQQEYDSETLPYKRGDIVDANGTVLATSEKVYNLILDSKAILADEDYLEPTLSALEECFDVDDSEIREYIADNPTSQYKILLKELTYDQIEPFEEMEEDAETGADIQGIWFEDQYKRYYPNDSLAADVIGFTTSDNVGTYGLEEYYNDILNGTNGREYGYLNDDSDLERTTIPAVDGDTIVSTIDVNVQSVVEKYLKEFNDTYENNDHEGLGAENLGAIVMDVNTGDVLAMASYPTYDLNDPKDISDYYTEDEIDEMEEDGTIEDTYNELWRNFCISDTYEPGSTAKPFTVAAALDSGTITGDETYLCTGSREIGGYTIHCHNTYGDGVLTVKQAVEKSCNIALTYIGDSLGPTLFTKYQHIFNFGLKTNIDLAGEARTDSLVYTADTMGDTELATNSFGQGFNVTMIQLITGFCSLINGGKYYEPHMVSEILSADGSVVKTIEPRVLRQTVSESVSDTIIDYCNGVVTEGTGTTARPAGYAIGGKTGTAETLPRGNGEYVVSFIGYAPADDPQIAVYVVVDRPNVAAEDDAKYATRIVRSILTEILPYEDIYMTEPVTEEEQEELDALQLSITTGYQDEISSDVSGNDSVVSSSDDSDTTDTTDGSSTDSDAAVIGDTDGDTTSVDTEIWKTFEVDPDTGNYIDPDTGHQIDPDTGDDLTGTSTGLSDESGSIAGGSDSSGDTTSNSSGDTTSDSN